MLEILLTSTNEFWTTKKRQNDLYGISWIFAFFKPKITQLQYDAIRMSVFRFYPMNCLCSEKDDHVQAQNNGLTIVNMCIKREIPMDIEHFLFSYPFYDSVWH